MRTRKGLSAALLISALSMAAVAALLTSCKGEDVKEPVGVTGVSVSPSSLSLTEGGSETLTATVTPSGADDKTVTWGSDKPGVASVDQTGKVTGVKAGSATITVTTKDGSKKATCALTIVEKLVAVESVTLDKTTLTMTEGTSGALKATVKPDNAADKAVTWSSSDNAVVTVDQTGAIKAVKAGSATITVTTKDGSKKATCPVTVKAPAAGEVVFEDANFKAALISSGVDANGDGMISESEAEAVTEIEVDTYTTSIASLGGIEKFTNLTSLICSGKDGKPGSLKSLNLSKNTKLETIKCPYNKLTSLDVSKNTVLKRLSCFMNKLTALDLSNNTALSSLVCDHNQLTALDLNKNTALTRLDCSYNQLSVLDISKNTALTDLDCYFNQLTSVDISNNQELRYFHCYANKLTTLDLSKNAKLRLLDSHGNKLPTLDVSNNTELSSLNCLSCQLATIDISKNTKLTWLNCSYNKLTVLDISNNTELGSFSCEDNQLTTIDVSKHSKLTGLYCSGNQLTSLDVSKNAALKYLYCNKNQLTSLDVSKNLALTTLYCSDMSTLLTLYMASGQVIDYINGTGDKARSADCIPAATTITVK